MKKAYFYRILSNTELSVYNLIMSKRQIKPIIYDIEKTKKLLNLYFSLHAFFYSKDKDFLYNNLKGIMFE